MRRFDPEGLVFLVTLVCFPLTAPAQSTEGLLWPTAQWQTAAPESAGFDSARLAGALVAARQGEPHLHGLVVIADGRIILEATAYPYDGRVPHNLASVTKSVMTTLIAIAADQGKLSLDQPVVSFFADRKIANLDDRKARMTVRHLAGMTSGLDCVGEHDEPTLHAMNASADWVQFALDLPMVAEPGTRFSYCSPGMHLLSAILQAATGQTAFDFASQNLFAPLGIREVIWPVDPQGVSTGWGDLHLLARDAAKIGYLWLNGGQWDGRQIVSADWVRQSSSLQVRTGPNWGDDYGYGWWVNTGAAIPEYSADGRGGQRVGVYPTLGIVAVTLGGGINPGRVLDAVGSAMVNPGGTLPPSPVGEQALREAIDGLALPPSAVSAAPLPAMAHKVSGRTYGFDDNPLQLRSVRLRFDGQTEADLWLTLSGDQPPRRGTVGLDGVFRMSPGENGLPVGMRGRWISADTFALDYDTIASIDAFDMTIRFTGDRVVIHAKDRTYEAGVQLEGRLVPGP